VHLVDQVHLVAARRGCIARVVEDLPHVLDLRVRRGVELEQVDEAAGVDVAARGARAAGRRRDALLAVQAFREDAGQRRLAHAAGARQQVRVMEAPAGQRVGQCGDDVRLPDQLGKCAWPPFAGEYLVAHRVQGRSGGLVAVRSR
jgi:hypothetical protein